MKSPTTPIIIGNTKQYEFPFLQNPGSLFLFLFLLLLLLLFLLLLLMLMTFLSLLPLAGNNQEAAVSSAVIMPF